MTNQSIPQEHDAWEADTIPSRLDELTASSRLAEREQYAAGWRRNLLIAALVAVIAAIVALLVGR